MKLRSLTLKDHQQFKDVHLDFTYKTGPKKGQPLEKVCFIGQSGTGKTTLLNVIVKIMLDYDSAMEMSDTNSSIALNLIYKSTEHSLKIDNIELKNDKNFQDNKMHVFCRESNSENEFEEINSNELESILKKNISQSKFALHFPPDMVDESGIFLSKDSLLWKEIGGMEGTLKTEEEINKIEAQSKHFISVIENKKVFVVLPKNRNFLWSYLMNEIKNYEEKVKKKGAELIEKEAFVDVDKMNKELQEWRNANPNPRVKLAKECLNPILEKIYLQMDTNVSQGSDVYIKVKHLLEDIEIPSHLISTGTKQIILSAIPLYILDTNGTIICMDEPERSLFPDIQQGLIEYYQSLAPNAQFFVATHSPMIAASFEPEERFILYFDETGYVKVKNGVAPVGDDPNDLLKKDFGLDNLMNEKGRAVYQEYLKLKTKIRNAKDETQKETLIKERLALEEKYNF